MSRLPELHEEFSLESLFNLARRELKIAQARNECRDASSSIHATLAIRLATLGINVAREFGIDLPVRDRELVDKLLA